MISETHREMHEAVVELCVPVWVVDLSYFGTDPGSVCRSCRKLHIVEVLNSCVGWSLFKTWKIHFPNQLLTPLTNPAWGRFVPVNCRSIHDTTSRFFGMDRSGFQGWKHKVTRPLLSFFSFFSCLLADMRGHLKHLDTHTHSTYPRVFEHRVLGLANRSVHSSSCSPVSFPRQLVSRSSSRG